MKFNKLLALTALLLLSAACQDRINYTPNLANTFNRDGAVGFNTMAVSVGQCGPDGYVNEPCVSVTICTPGTSTCQTIPNVLVDTGSYGLRIFSSAINIALPSVNDSSGRAIAECAYFGSANDWGPLAKADVALGGEIARSVPIQVINVNYASVPSPCTSPDTSSTEAGFNGILGVGLFVQDCGDSCASDANNQMYYACVGSSCTNVTMALAQQVSNPVSLLPLDNNGVILTLPSLPPGLTGAPSLNGTLTLGIGTQSDNMPSGATLYQADSNGNFITNFSGKTYNQSFVDSGSNGIFFPGPASLTACATSSIANGFYCPASPVTYTAVQQGASGAPSYSVTFQAGNAVNEFNTNNNVFLDVTGTSTSGFDWGLPFFIGRSIYVGIDQTSSPLGTGPYWAY